MKTKRMKCVGVMIFLAMLVLMVRLMQIQLFQPESFSKHKVNLLQESVKQRTQELLIDEGRGQFVDRNGLPLSYEEKRVLVLFPFLKDVDWDVEKVSAIVSLPKARLLAELEKAKEPFIVGGDSPVLLSVPESERINDLQIPGMYAISKKYVPDSKLAGQLLGITGESERLFQSRYPDERMVSGQKIGITGLQKNFDLFLKAEREEKLIYHVNGIGKPLFGMEVKYTGTANPYYPLRMKTTIDKNLQVELEALLDLHQIKKGGAVLLDVETNEIRALASRPYIDQKRPFDDDGTKNMMFEQHIPGSVFKTVIAGAAIEEGLVDQEELFDCNLDIYGKPAVRNLGALDLQASFARSCNKTFAELSMRLTEKDPLLVEEYALKLGVIGDIGWKGEVFRLSGFQQLDIDAGRIFLDKKSGKDLRLSAQTGIGQQEVRITPLGAANMMAAIARGGEHAQIRAVSEIQYQNGTPMFTFSEQESSAQISKYTAMQLQQLLKSVVTDEEGTGSHLQRSPVSVAGKSGTAETAIIQNGKQLHHKWFAGYFPFENPQYSLVVVNLDVPADEGGVNLLFGDIVAMIYNQSEEIPNGQHFRGY